MELKKLTPDKLYSFVSLKQESILTLESNLTRVLAKIQVCALEIRLDNKL